MVVNGGKGKEGWRDGGDAGEGSKREGRGHQGNVTK